MLGIPGLKREVFELKMELKSERDIRRQYEKLVIEAQEDIRQMREALGLCSQNKKCPGGIIKSYSFMYPPIHAAKCLHCGIVLVGGLLKDSGAIFICPICESKHLEEVFECPGSGKSRNSTAGGATTAPAAKGPKFRRGKTSRTNKDQNS